MVPCDFFCWSHNEWVINDVLRSPFFPGNIGVLIFITIMPLMLGKTEYHLEIVKALHAGNHSSDMEKYGQ